MVPLMFSIEGALSRLDNRAECRSIMPSQNTKDIPILMVLFGEEKLVWQYKQLDDPGQKLAMIWRTPYFQVNHL